MLNIFLNTVQYLRILIIFQHCTIQRTILNISNYRKVPWNQRRNSSWNRRVHYNCNSSLYQFSSTRKGVMSNAVWIFLKLSTDFTRAQIFVIVISSAKCATWIAHAARCRSSRTGKTFSTRWRLTSWWSSRATRAAASPRRYRLPFSSRRRHIHLLCVLIGLRVGCRCPSTCWRRATAASPSRSRGASRASRSRTASRTRLPTCLAVRLATRSPETCCSSPNRSHVRFNLNFSSFRALFSLWCQYF